MRPKTAAGRGRLHLLQRSQPRLAGRRAARDNARRTETDPVSALTFDNLEGIDARRSDAGETLVYLVSDHNYSFLQRTLLLMFRLVD